MLHPRPPAMPDQAGHKFLIQLLNQVATPMFDSSAHIILNPGQLVWLMEHTIVDNRWKHMPLGPFVIIVEEHNQYVLLFGIHLYLDMIHSKSTDSPYK